jgi:RNA polymerase sigma-70 factor (ECF subfamily)
LSGALGDLPAEQRTVLELAYFADLSASEIAARLNVPVGTVKSRTAAALGKLRLRLGDLPGGEP